MDIIQPGGNLPFSGNRFETEKVERRAELLKKSNFKSDPKKLDKYNKDLKEVMTDFEQIFIKQLLQDARKSYIEGQLFEESAMGGHTQDLFDENMSRFITKAGGFGLAKYLVEKYQKKDELEQVGEKKIAPESKSFKP